MADRQEPRGNESLLKRSAEEISKFDVMAKLEKAKKCKTMKEFDENIAKEKALLKVAEDGIKVHEESNFTVHLYASPQDKINKVQNLRKLNAFAKEKRDAIAEWENEKKIYPFYATWDLVERKLELTSEDVEDSSEDKD